MSGPAAGSYKHGRYSKHLPVQLQQSYEQARSDPRLLSLSDEVAVADARLAELFTRIDAGESGARWQQAQAAFGAFERASGTGDMEGMNAAFADLRTAIVGANQEAAAWGEIQRLWETRRRLVQTEAKTLVAMQQMVTTQQLMVMLGVITETITRTVKAHADETSGRKILSDIAVEFQRISTLEARH